MPKKKRKILGNYLYHAINRGNQKMFIFNNDADFEAFEKILAQGQQRSNMRIVGYCLMHNHWHLLLWPINDGDLSVFMHWITLTHTQRYQASHSTTGTGHIYQGRFKSFPVQGNDHYYTLLRYIEANPVKANIVKNASCWPWSSYHSHVGKKSDTTIKICKSPSDLPENWASLVNTPLPKNKIKKIQHAISRGCPLGEKEWVEATAEVLKLQSTIRPIGRPKKET